MTVTTDRFTCEHLQASERPKKRYRYVVTGKGQFPFDMLRYDRACPWSSDDARKLGAWPVDETFLKPRSIEMTSHNPPTIARWASFNWSVGYPARVEG
jgi:hypothetical protein